MKMIRSNRAIFILSFLLLICLSAEARKLDPDDMDLSESAVRRRWQTFEAIRESVKPRGEYPYKECFQKTADKYGISLPLLLAVARGESNFKKDAKSHAECYGIMQIQWPGTARHLGITRKDQLYDPCANIDAGGRYLAQLIERFNGDTFLALAAYNYGPTRIERDNGRGRIPEGARWYAAYIHNHLQYIRTETYKDTGRLLVLEPNLSYKHALRMRKHFEEKTTGIVFEIFRSDHYTYDLYITYTPGDRDKVIDSLYRQTAITPVEIKRLKGGTQ
jgi:hypothetical protein